MEEKTCSICGETNNEYFHTLDCNHSFHYNCLLLSFKSMGNNHCPYCRSDKNLLPVVNGVKKIVLGIHDIHPDEVSNYKIQKCQKVLTRGKNKGKQCSRNCKLGYDFCGMHVK